VIATAFTIGAFGVFGVVMRYCEAQSVGSQVRDLAQKIDRRLRVTIFQLPVRGAHTAKSFNAARIANSDARTRLGTNLAEGTLPTFAKASVANSITLLVRNYADGHFAGGIDGTAVDSTTAGITMIFRLGFPCRRFEIHLGKPPVFTFSRGIHEFE
jgi:hypothetical protein